MTSNFLLNNRLTFRDRRLRGAAFSRLREVPGHLVDRHRGKRVARDLHLRKGRRHRFVAAFAGIALDTMWKFVASSRIVWR